MEKTLASLGLLLATVLARGSCLTCETCISPGEGCNGLAHPCSPNEDTCLTLIGENSLGGGDTTETLKTCIAAADCYAGSISISTGAGVQIRSISRCCQDDLCNQWALNQRVLRDDVTSERRHCTGHIVPPLNLNPNSLRCPVCFAFESNHCEGNETLACTGVDNHCVSVSGTLNIAGHLSPFAARGCGTATACTLPLGVGLYSAGVIFTLDKVLCSPAPNAGSRGKKLSQG
ncbi:PREDICTED: phospholipase A2 inhibitor and Ly6/PLAUR domain-containing protein-like [Gekko japonicus]|uniref:Phospholipase A2 inhibitor and Ly6/PLAUR domain-containing protein-like n=1 Tax=Gekko japonicus TaxID=146911 RepID=A0ABM1K4G3_GEKJA|nr:PREDICTED: phospholipase A2 inhibitor and Ly6/PLAUR domain-containing protein-like [Gekko japonicus]